MKRWIKNIEPGSGLGELQFGLNKKKVIELIGEADRVFNEQVDETNLVEVWEYDELGLSLRFDGEDVMELTSLSIISSYYQYNGVSLIGLGLKEVREILKDVVYQLHFDKSQKQKLIYSEDLSLIIYFEYDIATSISWDPSEMDIDIAKKLQKHGLKKSRKKVKYKNIKARKKKIKERNVEKVEILQKEEKFRVNIFNLMFIALFFVIAFSGFYSFFIVAIFHVIGLLCYNIFDFNLSNFNTKAFVNFIERNSDGEKLSVKEIQLNKNFIYQVMILVVLIMLSFIWPIIFIPLVALYILVMGLHQMMYGEK